MRNKAIFLDRDGIINKIVYDKTMGVLHSPLISSQVEFVHNIFDFLKTAKKNGYLLIVISNQPNIGINKMTKKQFLAVKRKIQEKLLKHKIILDAEYYCFHHPFAINKKYKKKCNCKKPGILLYNRAINKFNIDVKGSWAIGDGVFDIIAGNSIGVKTILLANIHETAYFELIEKQLKNNTPDFIVKSLSDAAIIIENN